MLVLGRMKRLVVCMMLLVSNVEYTSSVANDEDRLLQTITQQAATISELESKVTNQESQLSQQATIISSLQASLAAQHSSNLQQDSGLQQLSQNVSHSTDRLAQLERAVQDLTNQQASSLQTLQSKVDDLETKQSNSSGLAVAFYADLGQPDFRNVTLFGSRPLLFNRVLTNVGNHYSIHSGTFTAPVQGLYSFTLHFMGANHPNTTELGIYADDSVKAIAYTEGGDLDSNDQGTATAVTELQQGQKVSVRLVYGKNVIWGSRLTNFSGMLIRAT